jgi:hypothetical protein
MTFLNSHTQKYMSNEYQLLANELKLKLTDAYKRIRTLELELQDLMVLVCDLKDQLYLKESMKQSIRNKEERAEREKKANGRDQ